MSAASVSRHAVSRSLRSTKSQTADAFRKRRTDIPNDFGLAPGTLVSPPKSALPPFAKGTWTKRLRASFYVTMLPITDWFIYYYTLYSNKEAGQKWFGQPYLLSERYMIARRLHRELYSAVAAGDKTSLNRIACAGLNRQMSDRIDSRKRAGIKSEKWSAEYRGWTPTWKESDSSRQLWKWALQAFRPKNMKSTRIVSDKYMPLPLGGTTGYLRQFIAEIKTTQTLDNGKTKKSGPKDEFVVLQQVTLDGVAQPWHIWGTTRRSDKADVEDFMSQAAGAASKATDTFKDSATNILTKGSTG